MATPRYVQLYIDLPNLTNGGNISALKTEQLIRVAVEIALDKGKRRLVQACVVYDERYTLLVQEKLKHLVPELGVVFIFTPRLTDGQQDKETVDGMIIRLITAERFMNWAPTTFLIVSDDQDFGVHFADLRNFGHIIETATPGTHSTLAGLLADREHSLQGEHATKRLHLYRALMAFVEGRSLQLGRLIHQIKDLTRYDHRQITNMAAIVAAVDALLRREQQPDTPHHIRFEDLRRLVGRAAQDHAISGVTDKHENWLTYRIVDSKIVVPVTRAGKSSKRLKLDPKHRLVRIIRDAWQPLRIAVENPREIEAPSPLDDEDAILDVPEDEAITVTDDGPGLTPVSPLSTPIPPGEPPVKESPVAVTDEALQSVLQELLRGTPLNDRERRPNRLARRLRDHLGLETRREGEQLLIRAFNNGWIGTANDRKGSPYLLEEELAQDRAG